MSTGAWVVVAAVLLTLGLGGWRAATGGRFRGTRAVPRSVGKVDGQADGLDATDVPAAADLVASLGHELGERATLLQFSSAFCAPCRATRRVLGEVTALVDGVTHVEIDAEHHLDATRELKILRTPTTLVLDAAGVEVVRATGAPTRDQVLTALSKV